MEKALLGGALGVSLKSGVERRVDGQAALEDDCRCELLLQLLLHVGDEVRRHVDAVLGLLGSHELERLVLRCLVLRGVYLLVVEHPAENLRAPGDRAFGVVVGVEPAGRLHDAGEQGALREREVLRRSGEVRLCCGLGAVRALTEVHGVEVHLENLGLGVALLELHREIRLAHLASGGHRGALIEQNRVSDVLLRDRRRALAIARRGLDHRTSKTHRVDADVAVEALVLDRDDAVGQ